MMKNLAALVAIICLPIMAIVLVERFSPTVMRVTEVRCKSDLDLSQRCYVADRQGSDLEIKVNPTTEAVQISIIKNDGNWWIDDFILNHCSIIDSENWKCEEKKAGISSSLTTTHGMQHGRYYRVVADASSPDINVSGVSGWRYWALHYHLINFAFAAGEAKGGKVLGFIYTPHQDQDNEVEQFLSSDPVIEKQTNP